MKSLTREARLAKGLTLQELAEKTDLSKSTIQNIESGKVSPVLNQLERIAAALDTKINALFSSKYK